MTILDNIFRHALDCAQQCGAAPEAAPLVALQLLAWRKVSEQSGSLLSGSYSEALECPPRVGYDRAIRGMEATLQMSVEVPDAWAHPALLTLMRWLQSVDLAQFPDVAQITQALEAPLSRRSESFLPAEIVALMGEIAGDLRGKSVYCLFDPSLQLTAEVLRKGGCPSVELSASTPLPNILKILGGVAFEHRFSHPLFLPSFREGDHQLRQFEVALSAFPWSSCFISPPGEDPYGRFKGDERTVEHQVIRHLLSQVSGTCLAMVPLSLVFSRQAGLRTLRAELVTQGLLRAVVTMPSGLLNHPAAGFALLVMDTPGRHEKVFILNADHSRYNQRDGRSRSCLQGWEALSQDLTDGTEGKPVDTGRLVGSEELKQQGYQLQANRYLQSQSLQQVDEYLKQGSSCALGALVQVLRPSLPGHPQGEEALEVKLTDFPPAGYLRSAHHPVTIEPRSNLDALYLRPEDLLIVTKGASSILGKVAIVGEEAVRQKWVANQMSLILRVIDPTKMDPRYLVRYLQSDLAQVQIQSFNLGGTIPSLRPVDLKSLRVSLPSKEAQAAVVNTFLQLVDLQDQWVALTRQRDLLAVSRWPRCPPSDPLT